MVLETENCVAYDIPERVSATVALDTEPRPSPQLAMITEMVVTNSCPPTPIASSRNVNF